MYKLISFLGEIKRMRLRMKIGIRKKERGDEEVRNKRREGRKQDEEGREK